MFIAQHFIYRNPALPIDGYEPGLGCMSKGGIPIQPFYILGGFIPDGVMGLPENPDYHKSTSVLMSVIVNNFDPYSEDPAIQKQLRQAKEWELAMINFLKDWEQNPENTKHMEISFYTERSVEDELIRQTSGDVKTIVISYVVMFVYIAIALGKFTSWRNILVGQ